MDSLEESGDLVPGEPETYTLSLPSRFNAENLKAIREREKELRVVSMLKSLQLLCSLTCQKAHLLNSKSHTAKSQKTKTRSQSLVTRLNDRLQYERLRYQGSRRYLLRLGASDLEKARFQELRSDDIQGLVQFLSRKRELGQTNATLPWFWKVSFAEGEGFTPDEHYQESKSGVGQEASAATVSLMMIVQILKWNGFWPGSAIVAGTRRFFGLSEK